MYRVKAGDTFLVQLSKSEPCPHLWIVLTDPSPDTGDVVVVSVSTLRNAVDQTVVLQRGDHPYIRHQSFVFYGDLRLLDAAWIDHAIDNENAKSRECCSQALLKLIRDGIFASDFTSPRMDALCRLRLPQTGKPQS